jgi:hypothetical protein
MGKASINVILGHIECIFQGKKMRRSNYRESIWRDVVNQNTHALKENGSLNKLAYPCVKEPSL